MNEETKAFDPLRLCDKGYLNDNLTFTSLYITIYEFMSDYVESKVKELMCFDVNDDGEIIYQNTPEYIEKISNRIVDDKGNRNALKASFLWLCDEEAITDNDYELFLKLKKTRNKYAHELASVIFQGVTNEEDKLLFRMIELYKKISKWWFLNIDAPIMGYNDNPNDVSNAADLLFELITQVLYNGKSEEYKKALSDFSDTIL